MTTFRTLLTRLLLLVAPLLVVVAEGSAQTYLFRAAHLVEGAPAIDVTVGSQTNYITNLSYEDLSGRSTQFPAGLTLVRMTRAGTATVVAERSDTLVGNVIYTFLGYGTSAAPKLGILRWTYDNVAPASFAKIRVMHGASISGAFDVYLDSTGGTAAFTNVLQDTVSPFLTVPAQSYSLIVTEAGSKTPLAAFVAPFASASIQALVISGTGASDLKVHVVSEGSRPTDPSTITSLQREQSQGAVPTLRFVHAFPQSAARSLDVYINGTTLAATDITYRGASSVLPGIGVGDVRMTLVPADGNPNDSVYGTSLTLARDTAYSLVLTQFSEGAPISLTLTRSLSEPEPALGKAKIRLANVVSYYPDLTFNFSGASTAVVQLPPFLSVTDWMEIDATVLNLQVFRSGAASPMFQGSAPFSEGEFVTLLAIGDQETFTVDLLRHTDQGAQIPLESFGAQQTGVRDVIAARDAMRMSATPNPASAGARISFTLENSGDVSLVLVDALGRHAGTLAARHYPGGRHDVAVDVSTLAPGAYTAILRTDAATAASRLVVVR